MSTASRQPGAPTERQREILGLAVDLVAEHGYAALTMRALARASDMKLGALQYHFRTSEALLRALAEYIAEAYRASFRTLRAAGDPPGLRAVVSHLFDDAAGETLHSDRLWPQLWAMARVEPVMRELLEGIHGEYLAMLEEALGRAGRTAPRAEALALMALVEGSTLFVGREARWAADADAVREILLRLVDDEAGRRS
jgi:AcrR family transcriptional regulator